MGALISSVRAVLVIFKGIITDYNALSKRIAASPGIPQVSTDPKCLPPYWTVPAAPVARHGHDAELPEEVDVVIIGSGITGTSVARALLQQANSRSDAESAQLRIVMLEARDTCSGSTGRNGGHVGPNIYNEYGELKKTYGATAAQDVLRFRLAHISTLLEVAREEKLLSESQARLVDALDAYMHPDMFRQAVEDLNVFLKEVPEDIRHGFRCVEGPDEIDKLQLVSAVVGCIGKRGAAIHPYRLVTGILSNLLAVYPNFQLFTHTPCTDVKSTPGSYIVSTPKGDLKASHIVHATNAWSSHLLPGMRGKVIPARTTMTALRPGKGISSLGGSNPWLRSFVFYPINDDTVFEYLTQLLPAALVESNEPSPTLPTAAELMFGGRTQSSFLDNIGVVDDNIISFADQAHLSGAVERYFANHWGEEGAYDPNDGTSSPPNGAWGKGRLRTAWSGLLGLSADLLPWVGRVPPSVSKRKEPVASSGLAGGKIGIPNSKTTLAKPGEWICAGYTGEGMVHAWLSGKAVARMVLGESTERTCDDSPKLPSPFLITEKRVKEARIENLVDRIGGQL